MVRGGVSLRLDIGLPELLRDHRPELLGERFDPGFVSSDLWRLFAYVRPSVRSEASALSRLSSPGFTANAPASLRASPVRAL